jgi:hypothetical protein
MHQAATLRLRPSQAVPRAGIARLPGGVTQGPLEVARAHSLVQSWVAGKFDLPCVLVKTR